MQTQEQNDAAARKAQRRAMYHAYTNPTGDFCRIFPSREEPESTEPGPHQQSTHWEQNAAWIAQQISASPAEKAATVKARIVADYTHNPMAHPADVAALHLIDNESATDMRAGIAQALNHIFGILDPELRPYAVQNVAEAITSALARQVERARHRLMQHQDQIRELIECVGTSEVTDTQLQDQQAAALMAECDEQVAEIAHQAATDAYRETLGDHWRPTTRSLAFSTMHTQTASMASASHFLKDRREREQRTLTAPVGYKVAVGGGRRDKKPTVDVLTVWQKLDKLKAAHSDLYLILTDEPGANQIARDWATKTNTKHYLLIGDFKSNPKTAGFRRNEGVVAAGPEAYLIFPGSGVTENLADLARAAGATVLRATTEAAAS